MSPPRPVKVGHKKDGCWRWPHRFRVSPPPPSPCRWIWYYVHTLIIVSSQTILLRCIKTDKTPMHEFHPWIIFSLHHSNNFINASELIRRVMKFPQLYFLRKVEICDWCKALADLHGKIPVFKFLVIHMRPQASWEFVDSALVNRYRCISGILSQLRWEANKICYLWKFFT